MVSIKKGWGRRWFLLWMPSKKQKKSSSAISHKLLVADVMLVSCAIVGVALIFLVMPSHMHTIPCLCWCWKRYDINYLFQAHILECWLQHKSTLIAIGFFSFVILYEVLASTLGARPYIFSCHYHCTISLCLKTPTHCPHRKLLMSIFWNVLKTVEKSITFRLT